MCEYIGNFIELTGMCMRALERIRLNVCMYGFVTVDILVLYDNLSRLPCEYTYLSDDTGNSG